MINNLEEFGRIIVQEVRDATIRSCDHIVRSDSNDAISTRWHRAIATRDPEMLAHTLIPDVVDSTIAHLLDAIDQEVLRLLLVVSNGETVDLTTVGAESGELSGWYGGEWRAKYTKERFVDDFADLKDFFDSSDHNQAS